MSKTIDITLVGDETGIEVGSETSASRLVVVSLSKDGFSANSDGTSRSITVDFSTLPSVMYWDNIVGKPTADDPSPFHEVAFTGDYEDLENLPEEYEIDTITNDEINNLSDL